MILADNLQGKRIVFKWILNVNFDNDDISVFEWSLFYLTLISMFGDFFLS